MKLWMRALATLGLILMIGFGFILGAQPVLASEPPVEINATTTLGVGESLGQIHIQAIEYGVLFSPQLQGLEPGIHGFHLHQNPSCQPVTRDRTPVPGLAAGGHYDPANTGQHQGPYGEGHLGDLPPLTAEADGSVSLPVLAPRLQLSDLQGRSLIIHAGGDNFSDQPAPLGGGGARVACGLIG